MLELIEDYQLLSAFWMTIKLAAWSAVFSLIIGTIVAIMRVSPVRIFQSLGTAYVTLLRNTPLTLIVLFASLGLWGQLGIELASRDSSTFVIDNGFRLAVLGLSVYHAAFVCEALRSGVNTIPVGQAEAARSIGLTFGQSLRNVILPQAFRGAITPLGNVLIALTKNTTVVAAIGVAETAYRMKAIAEFEPGMLMVGFAIVALGFVILTLPMGMLTSYLSTRLAVRR
ncbi:amino acid ABC transporter permease [Ornithinimicrobium cryptoxanthini]|uniref:Amino acid ABC transporter permease n=1 Tax=Ornithinimicrobium cryptoxanthini TaxID=2934161 RepID=A0ABY4YFD4_9MICO|nr:amino acid ABC transporter permease [Ornithinimicrobium cryptoxanthini]USQ75063.1 amino acid ABC transporter permease [Ornithinimicrobium cryptoxanthini]